MSGIDTSRGINSVASTIAALEANGVQTITTNTGAHVTGLEAAAYEFGAILASYPADAPPLTRNAAVFQVTDANGNTSMVSLNDLADDIKRQTGYDPLVEFSSGVGATNQGYSVADINFVLSRIESRFSSMTFTQLAQVQGNQDLVLSGHLDAQAQGALDELRQALADPSQLNSAFSAMPGGVDFNQAVFFDPNTVEGQASLNAISQLPALNQAVLDDQVAVINAQNALNQAQLNLTNLNYSADDQQAIANAQTQLNAISWPTRDADTAALNTAQTNYDSAQQALNVALAAYTNSTLPSVNMLDKMKLGISQFQAVMSQVTINVPAYPASYFLSGTNPQVNGHDSLPQWGGLLKACGIDVNDARAVEDFTNCLNALLPGASTKAGFSSTDISGMRAAANTKLNQWAQLNSAVTNAQTAFNTAQQTLATAQTTFNTNQQIANAASSAQQAALDAAIATANNHLTEAVNSAQANLDAANAAFSSDSNSLVVLMSRAMAQTSPVAQALKAQIQALTNQITTGLQANQQQLSSYQSTLQGAMAQLLELQSKLLKIPNVSFNEVLASIQSNTGIDLGDALSPIIGNGPLTMSNVNQIYNYINQNLPQGATPIPVLTNAQLVAAATQQLSNLFSQASFTQALANSPNGIGSNAAVFSLPGAGGMVSLTDALRIISSGTGTNLSDAVNSILNGQNITQQAVRDISLYCQNPPGYSTPLPPVSVTVINPATGQQLTLTGMQAVEYQLAKALSQVDLNALAVTGSPINLNAAIFSVANANNQPELVSLNQLLQKYASQGYELSSLLPPGATSIGYGDLTAMIGRLNADQTQAAFTVNPSAVLNAGLNQIQAFASSSTPLLGSTRASAIALLSALGIQEPEKVYAQAVLAMQLNSVDGQTLARYVATRGGTVGATQNLADSGNPITFASLRDIASQAGISLASLITMSGNNAQTGGVQFINGASFNALITQLNAANAGTPFVIANPFANCPDNATTSIPASINFARFTPPQVNGSVNSSLTSFSVFDVRNAPSITMAINSAGIDMVRAELESFTVTPQVQAVLSDIGTLISQQLKISNLDFNGNFSIDQLVFNAPEVSQSLGRDANSLVSFKEVLAYEAQNRGVNLAQALPNLADQNGKISFNTLNSLLEVINQSVPNINLPSLNGILLANPLSNEQAAAIPGQIADLESQIIYLEGQLVGLTSDAERSPINAQLSALSSGLAYLSSLTPYLPVQNQIAILQTQLDSLSGTDPSLDVGALVLAKLNLAPNANGLLINANQQSIANIPTFFAGGGVFHAIGINGICVDGSGPTAATTTTLYPDTLAGVLGIPMPVPSGANGYWSQDQVTANYQAVVSRLAVIAPSFQPPSNPANWTTQNLNALRTAIQSQQASVHSNQASLQNSNAQAISRLSSQLAILRENGPIDGLLGAVNAGLSAGYIDPLYSPPSLLQHANLPSWVNQGYSTIGTTGVYPGYLPSNPDISSNLYYPHTLAATLGIPMPSGTGPGGVWTDQDVSNQYLLITNKLKQIVPDFVPPASAAGWSNATLDALRAAIQDQKLENRAQVTQALMSQSRIVQDRWLNEPDAFSDLGAVKASLQNIQFEDVNVAVRSGEASASVSAAMNQGARFRSAPVLSAAEMNAQLESGDLYVSSAGQFFLNRQPTNARDASVAAMVIGGNKLNDKLNNMMNKINLNNTKIQMASYLSSASSIADLKSRIAEQKQQYGFSDILAEITGGAISDGDITDATDISATGSLQSSLKTAINNATRNQDLDTQSLQQLTSQIQALNTAMTQLIQAFEQSLKGLAQNLR